MLDVGVEGRGLLPAGNILLPRSMQYIHAKSISVLRGAAEINYIAPEPADLVAAKMLSVTDRRLKRVPRGAWLVVLTSGKTAIGGWRQSMATSQTRQLVGSMSHRVASARCA